MKNFLLIVLVMCFDTYGFSQRWQQLFGNTGTYEFSQNIIECYDNGYLLSGSYGENEGNWIIKTDINGELLWEKIIAWDNSMIIPGTPLQDTFGSIIIAGSIYTSVGNWPMINKIDNCGNPLWCRVFVDDEFDFAYFTDAILLENNDILALAHHEETGIGDTNSVFLYYINSDGDLLWKKPFASKADHPLINEPLCNNLFEFKGDYYISGKCYYAYPDNPNHVFLRAFCTGIDSLFNEKWILPFAMTDSIPGTMKSIVPLNDSVFMGVGIGHFPEGSGTSLYPNSFLMFFSTDGQQLSYNHIPNMNVGVGIQSNHIYDIARIDDTLFLASTSYGPALHDPNPFGEFVIDTSGQIFNMQSRPNTWGGSQLIKTYDNKYVICVGYKTTPEDSDILLYKINQNLMHDTIYSSNITYDSLCSSGIESGVIDITDCLVIVDIDEVPSPEDYYTGIASNPIVASPNPAKGSIEFSFSNTKNYRNIILSCYDTHGKEISSQQIHPSQAKTSFDISKWNSGMYLAVVTSNGNIVGQCKFVVW